MHKKDLVMGTIMITIIFSMYFQINMVFAEMQQCELDQLKKNEFVDSIKSMKCGQGFIGIMNLHLSPDMISDDITMEEEKEVDDIPFDTKKIVEKMNRKERTDACSMEIDQQLFSLEEEADADDIPFDTKLVYILSLLDEREFGMEEEKEVNDIPFDTHKVFNKIHNI